MDDGRLMSRPPAEERPPRAEAPPPGAPPTARRASLRQTFAAVFWSFFGVRKGRDYERDATHLNPIHVIVAGVIAAALFVVTLVLVVNWVVR